MTKCGIASLMPDVVVVGSGATGGCAVKSLTEAGLNVALIEAGDLTMIGDLAAGTDRNSFVNVPPSHDLLSRRFIQSACYACRGGNAKWFVDDIANPYVQLKPYSWIRVRGLGGRLLVWEGHSYRMSNLDFKANEHDGYGENWPIAYEDLSSYYDVAEAYLKVSGKAEGLPQLPDGVFVPPEDGNFTHDLLRDVLVRKFQRIVTQARMASVTRVNESGQNVVTVPSILGEVRISTKWSALTDAAITRRLIVIPHTIVYQIVSNDGGVRKVLCIDKHSRRLFEIRCSCVLLCASTLESTRILLNSGLCNSSGTLGHYLMDHPVGGWALGIVDSDRGGPFITSRRQHSVYIPRFRNVKQRVTNGFIRGYGLQGTSSLCQDEGPGGRARIRVVLSSFGECLARYENSAWLDPTVCDDWGIPVLRISTDWSVNERAMSHDAAEQAGEMLSAAGLSDVRVTDEMRPPGSSVHEVGTARMGEDASKSVVDKWCETHDVKNLFITDGACWVSSGCQNPTLTMMAITLRTCAYIVDRFRRG